MNRQENTEAVELTDTKLVQVEGTLLFIVPMRHESGNMVHRSARVIAQRGGLVLHGSVDGAGVVCISHARSGYRAAALEDEAKALAAMEALSVLFDWDSCFAAEHVLEKAQPVLPAIRKILREAGDERPAKTEASHDA